MQGLFEVRRLENSLVVGRWMNLDLEGNVVAILGEGFQVMFLDLLL